MKSIYILLTRSDTWVSKAINLATEDRYTHASISFEESLEPLYSYSRKYIYLPLPAGLRIEPLNRGFFKKYHHIPCAVYELRVTEAVYEAAKQVVERMMIDAPRCRFNLIGLFLCKLQIPWHRENRYFCSEFVSEVLTRSGALALPKVPSLMRPNDYTEILALSCKFEGRLSSLVSTS